jgi:uncharacterized protein YbbK (DUF523 family)
MSLVKRGKTWHSDFVVSQKSGLAGLPIPRSPAFRHYSACGERRVRFHDHGDCRDVSRRMLERYSHVRMEAKRNAMEALALSTKTAGYDTNHGTNPAAANTRPV